MMQLSSSPTSMSFSNPCLPPFPHPTVLTALAQIRSQPTLLSQSRHASPQSQDENCLPTLKVVACFSTPRTLDGFLSGHIGTQCLKSKTAVDSLFIMSSQGTLTQYDLEPLPATGSFTLLSSLLLCLELIFNLPLTAQAFQRINCATRVRLN